MHFSHEAIELLRKTWNLVNVSYGPFMSEMEMVPIHFLNCMEKSRVNITQIIAFCVLLKKESHMGLEQHDGE